MVEDPAEIDVRQEYARRAQDYARKLQDVPNALKHERERLELKVRELKINGADFTQIAQARRELVALPKDVGVAQELWTRAMQDAHERSMPLAGMPRQTQAFQGDPQGTPAEREAFETSRWNFLALTFCLMLGTAGMPHLLTRFYTTSSVAQTRSSVAWSLFFIVLLHLS